MLNLLPRIFSRDSAAPVFAGMPIEFPTPLPSVILYFYRQNLIYFFLFLFYRLGEKKIMGSHRKVLLELRTLLSEDI